MRADATNRRTVRQARPEIDRTYTRERNASQAMTRLLATPPPLAPNILACGTQFTKRWTRDGFSGYAPGMAGHLIGTYYGPAQECTWTLEGRRLADSLRPGTVTLVAEGHDGQWALAGPVSVSHVYLTNQRLQNCAAVLVEGKYVELFDRLAFDDPICAHILSILSDAAVLSDPSAGLLVERAVDLLCTQLLRQHCSVGLPDLAGRVRGGLARWQLKRVTDYMLEHRENPVALEELATLVGLSRYHFCTAFGLAMGRTPHAWLTEQRMTRARRLLSDPDMSISEIAVAVGYATPSAFSASFRRIVGMTPSDFRRVL